MPRVRLSVREAGVLLPTVKETQHSRECKGYEEKNQGSRQVKNHMDGFCQADPVFGAEIRGGWKSKVHEKRAE